MEPEWNGGEEGMSRWPATATDPLLGGLPGSPEPGTLQRPPLLSAPQGVLCELRLLGKEKQLHFTTVKDADF